MAAPCVADVLADVGRSLAIVDGAHIQRKAEGAVAAHLCAQGVIIERRADAEGVESHRVVSPREALVHTHVLHLCGVVDWIDREVHRDDAVATADSEQRVGVGARGRQQSVAKGVGAPLTDILVIRTAVGVVLLYAAEHKRLLERKTRNVGGADAHRIVEQARAAVAGVGEELVALDVEEAVARVAAAADQLIGERQRDVVVDRREAADKRTHRRILHERRAREQDVHRSRVVVNHRVGNRLDRLLIAHVVGGAGDEAVHIAVNQRIVRRVGRCVIAHSGVHAIVERHHQLHIVHAAALWVVGGGKGKVAHHRVRGQGLRRKVRGGRHRVESILPHIGGNGRILIEHDGSLHRHRVARSEARLRKN